MKQSVITVAAVGDVMVNRARPESIFALTGDILRKADIAFCPSEAPYSDKGSKGAPFWGAIPHDARNYQAIPAAGFDVVSNASNKALDWGWEAMQDFIARLRSDGIASIGAGANIDEARRPAIIERAGTRIAFLAYCSVAPNGYYASLGRPGVAPMRAITHYEPLEEHQPGHPCEILTYPVEEDLNALVADIHKVRQNADVVAVSLHWGIHLIRAEIAGYQPIVARAAIDAGADIIIGHHPHILKGIDVYKGKVILYSIGNFAFDMPKHDIMDPERFDRIIRRRYHIPEPEPESPFIVPGAIYSVIAKISIADKRIQRVSLVPVLINSEAQPEPVSPSDPKGQKILEYLREVHQEANRNATLVVEGEEVVIGTSSTPSAL